MKNDYRGFCLFNDIEDKALQTRNRAVVLANIAQDHTKDRRINAMGAGLVIGYFDKLPPEDRAAVRDAFEANMIQRGFVLAKAPVSSV
jgi:hypothetical protein